MLDVQRFAETFLLGLPIGTGLQLAIEEMRARLLAGVYLVVDLPDHDHPHRLLDLEVEDARVPGEVRLHPKTDPCPEETP